MAIEIPFSRVKDGIIIEVRVLPRSSKKEVSGVVDNVVKVKLTAPPVDGAANEQLIEVLSKQFSVKKSSIIILKGETAKRKTVKITGV